MLRVTVGGQLEILMVVEDLLLKGFRVVSLNTDGFDAIVKKDRETEFKSILSKWEEIIGNNELGNFEYTDFLWIAQTSVNDYIALKTDGSCKMKGDFEIDKELHKNKSKRIVPIALKEYFVNKTPIEQTIKNHSNIYDFTIRQKASKDFHYEGIGKDSKSIYKKLIRYYISTEGEKILKIKEDTCQTNAAPVSNIEAGGWLCKVCNKLPKETKVSEAKIDFRYYIEAAQDIINKVEHSGKKIIKVDPCQISLF